MIRRLYVRVVCFIRGHDAHITWVERNDRYTGPVASAVHEGECTFEVNICPAGQCAAFGSNQHIIEIQF